VGFSGPTPCRVFRVNALTGSREFLGVQKTGLSAPIFFAPSGQKSISAQSLALLKNGVPAVFQL
jgi:hypothetical protein